MKAMHIDVSDAISTEDFRVIEIGLNHYNDDITGFNDRQPLSVIVRDSNTGNALGGITGRSSLGLLFIDLVWLAPELRSQGLGKELLSRFEIEGKKRGCIAAVLYTISFQAPDFYKKNGWEVFGEVSCKPDGTSRVFMTKTL